MNFQELYHNNRRAVERALTSMWCGESPNELLTPMTEKIRQTIGTIFAPEAAVPVVQCNNSYKSVHSVAAEEAASVVGGLWQRDYPPYEHQWQAWHTLLGEATDNGLPLSICVTTGTGSGKTECFMMPLVHQIAIDHRRGVGAILLYPLNALMDDQKQRLERLLTGTGLRYTVYNGDLPEREPSADDHSPETDRLRRRIDELRGITRDERGAVAEELYPSMLYTREMVRSNPPEILLTNPTMLEYILLRGKDQAIIKASAGSLRWVAIDETHTYSGAGAAELAMLLRRVLLAFGTEAKNVHFATSSATIGKEEDELMQFVAGITGQERRQVRIIGGERQGEDYIPTLADADDRRLWGDIFAKEYVSLGELFPEGTVEEKLGKLEGLCSRVEGARLKVKVHYFYRVPTGGLHVRLTELDGAAFHIHTDTEIGRAADAAGAPLIELCRCRHCGGYVAVAKADIASGKYMPLEGGDDDLFDLPDDSLDADGMDYTVFGLADHEAARGDGNICIEPAGDKIAIGTGCKSEPHIVGNMQSCCPYCGTRLTGSADDEDDTPDRRKLQRFRLSAEFLARLIAPSILNQLAEHNAPGVLHRGQQYISFVDSRQTAAKQTMHIDEEQERMWLYTTLYRELCRRAAEVEQAEKQRKEIKAQIVSGELSDDEIVEAAARLKSLKGERAARLSWDEAAALLYADRHCATLCNLFVKHGSQSDETNDDGTASEPMLRQYVQSLMVQYLGHRPLYASSPENLGLSTPAIPR